MERRAEETFAHLLHLGDGSILEGVYAGIESGWFVAGIADARTASSVRSTPAGARSWA